MKLEKQVCSIELAKRLKELNCKQESLFYWRYDYHDYPELVIKENLLKGMRTKVNGVDGYSAFTVAELGEMLPKGCASSKGYRGGYDCEFNEEFLFDENPELADNFYDRNILCQETQAETEADARAKMLVYLIENKLIII